MLNSVRYLEDFLKKRLVTVYLPYLIAQLIYAVVYFAIFPPLEVSNGRLFLYLIGILLFNGTLWYIVEIMVFYLIFYVKNRYLPALNDGFFWTASLIIFLRICAIGELGLFWYRATPCLIFGILYAKYENHFEGSIPNRRYLFSILQLLFLVLYVAYVALFFWQKTSKNGADLSKIFNTTKTVTGFVLPILFLFFIENIERMRKKHNTFEKFLSGISLEIYLYHNVSIMIIGTCCDGLARIVLTVGFSILLAVIMKYANKRIIKCIQ